MDDTLNTQYTVLPCQSCGHEQHLALMQIAGRFGVYVVVGEGMTLVGQLPHPIRQIVLEGKGAS